MVERRYLSTKETARYTGWSEAYLRQSRCEGIRKNRTPGPPFIKVGWKVLYDKQDLDEWLQQYRREPT